MKRIYSIDFTRGVVMIIMALDHVRDLMHVNSVTQSPTDLTTTTPFLFFTRWITYLCAPIFVFLAGTSAYLSLRNKSDVAQSKNFLFKRGLWLVILDLTTVCFGLFFDIGFHTILFEVIATIGVGFIILSLLVKLPAKTIGIIGVTIIFCHNLLALIPLDQTSIAATVLSSLFSLRVFPFLSNHIFIVAYPPIPWLGIMLAGFGVGKLFELSTEVRTRLFWITGFAALLLFILLRYINIYGDPIPWSQQPTTIYTFLSFMNITKYPPSLLFCLITLGVMFLILAIAERLKGSVVNISITYGRVPMFYFLLHFYLIHSLLIIILFLQGFHWEDLSFATGSFGRPQAPESGLPLWGVYIVWIVVVASLYWPCKLYGEYKSTHKHWWLNYL